MIAAQFRTLVAALNAAGCEYLVAGGLAVIAHGFVRLTGDIDIIFDLDRPDLARKAFAVLTGLGYRPRLPVSCDDFLDRSKRETWIRDREMLVFSLYAPPPNAATLDVFAALPFPFAPAWADRAAIDIGAGIVVPFVDLGRLLAMKQAAGRPKDLEDIRNLRLIQDP